MRSFLAQILADRWFHLHLAVCGCVNPLFYVLLVIALVETWRSVQWRRELNRRRLALREYPQLRKASR